MIHEIYVYLFQHMPAACIGFGVGLAAGAALVAAGATRQYMKGREDGYEAGREKGEHTGWNRGFIKGEQAMKERLSWERGPYHAVRKSDRRSGYEQG
jgi:hypothetical protein